MPQMNMQNKKVTLYIQIGIFVFNCYLTIGTLIKMPFDILRKKLELQMRSISKK